MTQIDIDGEDAASGLISLVVAVVEILVETMQREALRRMDADQLTDEEVDRLGRHFAALEAELDRIKEQEGIHESVDDFRGQVDDLVSSAVWSLDEDRAPAEARRPTPGAADGDSAPAGSDDPRGGDR